ncbi:hypothetical protein J8N08_22290 [Agrobacterium tumefaciens]|uniref:hypothetical protein n=1 Tax=Agrobacterium tumefaciens TaxID=358 RepID=UPI001BB7D6A7|nr:hypothetical protein J8N08_22290 [Agrobacterium tumefaciens]UXT82656.1 hypothetical protein FY131_14105 [Agrobacterium tumefaciens]
MKTTSLSTHQRQALVVLGMHRSGTSALARVLNLLGCATPNTLIEKDEWNAEGYWESLVISRFNEKVLEAGGSVWHDWHKFNPTWLNSVVSDAFVREAVQLLSQEYGDAPLIVLKDPRMSLLFPFWRLVFEHAGISPRCVVIQRNPMEVAASLEKRNGFSTVKALLIWLRYTLDAERFSRGLPRDFTTYENLLSDFRNLPGRWEAHLDVAWPRKSDRVIGEMSNFMSGNLRHHNFSGARYSPPSYLSPWIARVFETLRGWADRGEDRAEWEALDSVYEGLSAAEKPFATVIREIDSSVRVINELRDSIGKEKTARKLDAAESEKRQQMALAQLTTSETQHEFALNKVEEQFQAEISSLHKKLDEAQVAHDHATAEIAKIRETAAGEIAALEKRLVETQAARDRAVDEARQLRETSATEISDVHKNLVQTEAERDEAVDAAFHLRAEVEEERKKLEELRWALTQTQSELRQRAHEASETAGELVEARKTLSGLAQEKDVLASSLSDATARIATLRQDFDEAQHASEQALHLRFDEIARLTKSYITLESEKIALRSKLSDIVADILRLAEKPWRPSPLVRAYKVSLLRQTGIFDPEWYLDANPDVRDSGMDPALHFVRYGFDEGRSPLPDHPRLS